MTALEVFRDDGPLATSIGRNLGRALPIGEVPLTLLGAVPLIALLAAGWGSLPTPAVAAAAVAFIVLAGAGSGRSHTLRLSWLVPPLLRAVEYAFVVTLTALAEPAAMPVCFAFLGVLAFHHYDVVYRLRHQRAAPPSWLHVVGGGWDGRLAIASILALAGILAVGLVAAAIVLALVYVTETTSSWLRFERTERAPVYDEGDDELVE